MLPLIALGGWLSGWFSSDEPTGNTGTVNNYGPDAEQQKAMNRKSAILGAMIVLLIAATIGGAIAFVKLKQKV